MNIEKLKRLQDQVRIGGKGTPRRKKKVIHQTTAMDDKKLQTSLKKIGVSTIPGIEEVNIIKDDLSVINFKNPKVQASLSSNTFALTGHGENKKVMDMLPEILPQLGQETVMQLRMFASSMVDQQKQANAALNASNGAGDDDVPMLIGDFDEIARLEADKPIEQSKPQGRNIKEQDKKSDNKNKSNAEQPIGKKSQSAEEQNGKDTSKNKKQEIKKNKKANKKQNKLSKDSAGGDVETVVKSESATNGKNKDGGAAIVKDEVNNIKPTKDVQKDLTQKKCVTKNDTKSESEQKKDTKSPTKDKELEQKKDTKSPTKDKELEQKKDTKSPPKDKKAVAKTKDNKQNQNVTEIKKPTEQLESITVSKNIEHDALNSKGILQQNIDVAAKLPEKPTVVEEKVAAKSLEETNVKTSKEPAANTKVISTPNTVQPNNENKTAQPLAQTEVVQSELKSKHVPIDLETKTDKQVEPKPIQQEPELKKETAQTQEVSPNKADVNIKKPIDNVQNIQERQLNSVVDVKPVVEAAVKVTEQQQEQMPATVNAINLEKSSNVLEQTEVKPIVVPAEVKTEIQQSTNIVETVKSIDVKALPIANESAGKVEVQLEKPAVESYAAALKTVEEKDLIASLVETKTKEVISKVEKTIDAVQTKKNNEDIKKADISSPTIEAQPVEVIKSIAVETIESNITKNVEAIETLSNEKVTLAEGAAEKCVKDNNTNVKETELEKKVQDGKPAANKKAPTSPGLVKQKSKPIANTAETKKPSSTDIKKANENTKQKQTPTPKSQKQQTTIKSTAAPAAKPHSASPKTPTKAQEKPNSTEKPNLAATVTSVPASSTSAADIKATPPATAAKATDNEPKQDGNKAMGTPKKQTDASKPKQPLAKNRTTSTSSTSSNKGSTGSPAQGNKSTKSKQQKSGDAAAAAGKN